MPRERWRELCLQVAQESNSERIYELVRALTCELDAREEARWTREKQRQTHAAQPLEST